MSINPLPDANFTPQLAGYSGQGQFRFWCQKVLPIVYDDSLSYYELLNKVVVYLNHVIEDVANEETNIELLRNAYNQLQEYVNTYFDSLDVQEEINHKINEMVVSGEFLEITQELISSAASAETHDMLPLVVESQLPDVVENQLPDVVEEQLPDIASEQIPPYVSDWLGKNVSPVGSAVIVDSTLTIEGAAADAWVTGDQINKINSALEDAVYQKTETDVPITLNVITGSCYNINGGTISESMRAHAEVSVVAGEVYSISTFIRPTTIAGVMFYRDSTLLSYILRGSGSDEQVVDYEFTIPGNCNKIIVQTAIHYNTPALSLSKKTYQYDPYFPSNEEFDQTIGEINDKLDGIQNDLDDFLYEEIGDWEDVELNVVNGTCFNVNGGTITESQRARSSAISVNEGDRFRVSSYTRPTTIAAIMFFSDGSVSSYDKRGSGTEERIENYEFVVPAGCDTMYVQTADRSHAPHLALSKLVYNKQSYYYTKDEINDIIGENVKNGYGIKWNDDVAGDEGERCFKSVGLNAVIGVGDVDGSSDFDDIYPWCDMKRCNIVENANGAKLVIYEGEDGFSLTDKDVFVKIPKFTISKFKIGTYRYVVIGCPGAPVHEAFVENGKELDEIFVSAFEGCIVDNKLASRSNRIPACNYTPRQFLSYAKNNGNNFTMYDMRTVDAIWCLMCVEYGKRNTNKILGYGLADFMQPTTGNCRILEDANNTNIITVSASYNDLLRYMPVGSNITICGETQQDIIAQRKIVAINETETYCTIQFDGEGINVTSRYFCGTCGFNSNWCELSPTGALSWHTGRNNWIADSIVQNAIRYRWIENLFGNIWSYLPDVTFYDLQMYVCKNMDNYEIGAHSENYIPVYKVLPEQTSNGNKSDSVGPNYWVTKLVDDCFNKGILFGAACNNSINSEKCFGGYYYLYRTVNNNVVPIIIANGGGFDHLYRCNMLTQRAWIIPSQQWYLYGARLIYKNIH